MDGLALRRHAESPESVARKRAVWPAATVNLAVRIVPSVYAARIGVHCALLITTPSASASPCPIILTATIGPPPTAWVMSDGTGRDANALCTAIAADATATRTSTPSAIR